MEDKPGYGKPPKEHQFTSENQPEDRGRPKGSRNRSTIVREILEVIENGLNPITNKHEELSQEQLMTLAVLVKAKAGDVKAYQALMDSAFGAPKQEIDNNLKGDLNIIQPGKPDDNRP